MPRILKIAAVQMNAEPAPTHSRLERAADLVAEAASQGAQLVVLPEVFNTGYAYTDENYQRAERMDGLTVTWMKAQAAQHGVHLAGTLLLLDERDIFNAMVIIAPDGRTWRYDKRYPWAWERAYFREGTGTTTADTDLGRLGMMICWDYAHATLWQEYAGQVDVMLIPSCPPAAHAQVVAFPDGQRFDSGADTSLPPRYSGSDMPFGAELDALAGWLGVPAVVTAGAGQFRSTVPAPRVTMSAMLAMKPELLAKYGGSAAQIALESGYYPQTKIVNARGEVVARVTPDGEGCTLAEVTLADHPPQPAGRPPKTGITPLSYLIADGFVPAATASVYRSSVRRIYGQHMAPRTTSARLLLAALVALGLGWVLRRKARTG